MPAATLRTPTISKKVPIAPNVATSATSAFSPNLAPAMASMAPNAPQPNIGAASVMKCSTLPNGRGTSSNTNSSKPLGSSENPIQLIQQGQTFHRFISTLLFFVVVFLIAKTVI